MGLESARLTATYTVELPATLGWAENGYGAPPAVGRDLATTTVGGRLEVAGYHQSCVSCVVGSVWIE